MQPLAILVNEAKTACKKANIANYLFNIFILLEHYSSKTKLDYIADPEQLISQTVAEKFHLALNQLIAGKPLYRIIGTRNFFGLDLHINEYTLEPRFDTEIIVELAIKYIKHPDNTRFLDLGVGSGAISLAVLYHYRNSNLTGVGVDICPNCLHICNINSQKYNLQQNLKLLQSDLFSKVTGKFNLIISNPPYIPSADIDKLDAIVKNYDPLKALDGGKDGLDYYRKIAQQAHKYLREQGLIIIEIGSEQKSAVIKSFEQNGYKLIEAKQDYNNLDRALVFTAY